LGLDRFLFYLGFGLDRFPPKISFQGKHFNYFCVLL
jgi:hypothetical protein